MNISLPVLVVNGVNCLSFGKPLVIVTFDSLVFVLALEHLVH